MSSPVLRLGANDVQGNWKLLDRNLYESVTSWQAVSRVIGHMLYLHIAINVQ